MADLVSTIDVSRYLIVVKFAKSIIPASFGNDDAIQFMTNEATPQDLSHYLRSVDITDDYDSIRRELTLYFENLPDTPDDFQLTFNNLVTVGGVTQPSETHLIAYHFDNTNVEDPGEKPEDPPPTVVDHSIQTGVPYSGRLGGEEDGSPELLSVDQTNGIITITFSEAVDPVHLIDDEFKVDRKEISIDQRQWLEVTADSITLVPNEDNKVVEIDLTNALEDQYKYRVRVGKTASGLSAVTEILFITSVTPIIGDPEYISYHLPDEITEVEIVEAMYRASKWALKALDMKITDDLPFVAYEYVEAAAQCDLSKIHGLHVKVAPNQSVRLGDLSITAGSDYEGRLNRGNATDVCELAYALRKELIRSKTRSSKVFQKGARVMTRLPQRVPKGLR